MSRYPDAPAERDRWILARRSTRPVPDVRRPQHAFVELEPDGWGHAVPILTLLLTGRECPWRCLMCDLWKFTVRDDVPVGAVPAQIASVLRSVPEARAEGIPVQPRWLKLYNSGSFFDPRSVPPDDDAAIARLVGGFERVIVECHPALIGARVTAFRDLLAVARGPSRGGPALEVAMGLETVHPVVLDRLNKRLTLDQFRRAADRLGQAAISLRAFVLVKPPFLTDSEALDWAQRSVDFAFDCGAAVVSLIPTRFGNGALEALAEAGQFAPPGFALVEAALEYGLHQRRGRVLADLWDAERLGEEAGNLAARMARLRAMNLQQTVLPAVDPA